MIKSAGVPMVSDLVPPRRFPVFNALLCLLLLLGIAKGAEAAGVRPPETATVTYNGAKSKITLTAPSGLSGTEDIAFLYETRGAGLTARGGIVDCRSAPTADVIDMDYNEPVVVTKKDVRAGTKITLPVKLCSGSQGKTFKVIWETSNYIGDERYPGTQDSAPFDITAPNCSSMAHCWTTVTIRGTEPGITITPGTSPVTEGAVASFTVKADQAPTSSLTVSLSVSEDTSQGQDFVASGNEGSGKTVTIAAGKTSATYTVNTAADSADEPDGTVTVTVDTGTGYKVGSPNLATVTVNDDDDPPPADPVVTFADVSSSAGEAGGTRNVTVNLSPVPHSSITLSYTLSGTAVLGTDYSINGVTSNSATIAVSDGIATVTIPVAITDDSDDEDAETIVLTLNDGTGYELGGQKVHTLTITDNDDPPPPADPVVTFADASSSAGEAAGTRNVTVNLSPVSHSNITLSYTLSGTATLGTDYSISGVTSNSATIAVSDGIATVTIPVAITDDSDDEDAETIILTLNNGTGYDLGGQKVHTLTITDNDDSGTTTPTPDPDITPTPDPDITPTPDPDITPTPDPDITPVQDTPTVEFDSARQTVDEETAGTVNIGLTVSPAPGTALTLNYRVNGTATVGSDYSISGLNGVNGTLTVDAGATSVILPVRIIDDQVNDSGETVEVSLTSGNGYDLGASRKFTLTIMNDEIQNPGNGGNGGNGGNSGSSSSTGRATTTTPKVRSNVLISSASATEGETIIFQMRVEPPNPSPITLEYATNDGTAKAGSDYTGTTNGRMTIPANSPTAQITIPTMADNMDEDDELFTLSLSRDGSDGDGAVQISGMIKDDDQPPSLALADAEAEEGEPLVFSVSLSSPSSRTISVDWSLTPGTAVADTDYASAGGTLRLPAGAKSGAIMVESMDDAIYEANENFTLALSSPQHATLSRAQGTGTLLDNDELPVLFIGDAEAREGEPLIFPFILSVAAGQDVSVEWSLTPGTAEPDVDYLAEGGTVMLPAGVSDGVIVVMGVQDDVDEPDETLTLNLSAPRHTALDRDRAQGILVDDDAAPQLLAEAQAVREGDTLVFNLSLAAPSALPVSVDWRTADATATSGEDYTAAQGTVQLAPGQISAELQVMTLDDDVIETEEIVNVVLSNPQHVLTGAEISGHITDDDAEHAARLAEVNEAILPQVSSALIHARLDQLQDCIDGSAADLGMNNALGSLVQRLPQSEQALADDNRSLWERFGGSRFRHTFGADGEAEGDTPQYYTLSPYIGDITVCAGMDWRRLADERMGTDWDGSLYGGHLGGHVRLGTYTLAGVNISQNYVDIDYETAGDTVRGDWELSLTGVQPYFSRSWEQGQRVWAMAGWGAGELTLEETERRQEADVNQWQMAFGGSVPLHWGAAEIGGWERAFQLRGDAWWGRLEVENNGSLITRMDTHTNGLRTGLDSSFTRHLDTGSLSLTTGAGMRYDNGVGGAGVEWSGGMNYTDAANRLHAGVNARALLLRGHTREWGISAMAKLEPEPGGRGLSFSVAPGWGQATSAADALWDGGLTQDQGLHGTDLQSGINGMAASGPTFNAELGYGLRLSNRLGLLTPVSAFNQAPRGRQLRMGLRWLWQPGLTLELDGRYRKHDYTDTETGVFLTLGIRDMGSVTGI